MKIVENTVLETSFNAQPVVVRIVKPTGQIEKILSNGRQVTLKIEESSFEDKPERKSFSYNVLVKGGAKSGTISQGDVLQVLLDGSTIPSGSVKKNADGTLFVEGFAA